ncbi:MAG TPA: M23 family metallopeptidase [Phaeodactylibacter sp.]|nr:M23 family metallopeptidase [Phaeodactylibacter sp.]
MNKHFFFLSIGIVGLLCLAFATSDHKEYPQNYFQSPVDRPIYLSGTFGELRPNHLHAGIDIKAYKGKIGQPIYAVADGYVSRIKMQSGSYGKVVYVNHPNGYTSVYAHLHQFTDELEKYVRDMQYRKKSFEVDLFPQKGRFAFRQGEQIGTLGLSGRSYGPHLHFEIRDTKTEKPINPLLFGFKTKDSKAPRIHEVKAYFLNDKRETLQSKTWDTTPTGGTYHLDKDTLLLPAWRVGFGIKTYDHMNGVNNWNGVYAIKMYQDGELRYAFEMETFAFFESRYINAHLDYAEQVSKKSYFNRMYRLPGNRLSIYSPQINDGVVKLSKRKSSKITFEVEDLAGNTSRLEFWVRRAKVKMPPSKTYNYLLPYDEENIVDNGTLYLYFPKRSLYENLYLQYHSSTDRSTNVYSSVHHVHEYTTPVHRYFDIAIRTQALPDSLRSKAFIAYCAQDNKIYNCGGKWKDGRLQSKVRLLGDYCIMIDDVPPSIKAIHFKKDMRGFRKMSFKVTDNFETAKNIAPFNYEATIDGKWILMEYDAKKDLLTYYFDDKVTKGEHSFRLLVSDDRGNESVFERTFIF